MKGNLGYKIRTIICQGCGKTVTAHFSPHRKYCSHACFRNLPKPERRSGGEQPCAYCGQTIYVNKSNAKLYRNSFCSREHANAWQARSKVTITCKICDKSFLVSPVYKDRPYCSIACRNADPSHREMLIRINAAQREGKANKLEACGYAMLDGLGVPYLPQHLIADKFCVDAFVPSCGVVIQFDGDYWHGNPERFPTLSERQKKRVRLDKSQDAYMIKCGYHVVRLWESELKRNPQAAKERLQEAVSASENLARAIS